MLKREVVQGCVSMKACASNTINYYLEMAEKRLPSYHEISRKRGERQLFLYIKVLPFVENLGSPIFH